MKGLKALCKTVGFSNRAKVMNSLFGKGERKQEGKFSAFYPHSPTRSHHLTLSSRSASLNSQLEEWGKASGTVPGQVNTAMVGDT